MVVGVRGVIVAVNRRLVEWRFLKLHVRQRLSDRCQAVLAVEDRGLVIALCATTALAMGVIAMAVLGIGPVHHPTSARTHAATGLIIFAAVTLGLSALSGLLHSPAPGQDTVAKLTRLGIQLLPAAGLVLVGLSVLNMDYNHRANTGPTWTALRACEWLALGVGCVFVARPTRPGGDELINRYRAVKIVFPAMLWMVALAVPIATGYRAGDVIAMLETILRMHGYAGIGLAFGLTVAAAAKGLEGTRDHGSSIAKFVNERKHLLVGVVVAKLLVLFAVWGAYRRLRPDEGLVSLRWPALTMTLIAAAVALTLFVIDSHIRLLASDHAIFSRYAGLTMGTAVGGSFLVVAVACALIGAVVAQPASLIGATALVLYGLLHSRTKGSRTLAAGFAVAGALAVAVTFLLGPGDRNRKFVIDMQDKTTNQNVLGSVLLLFLLVLITAAVLMAISAARRPGRGWLTCGVTVGVWFVVMTVWNVVDDPRFVEFDVGLTVLLGASAVLLILGAQRTIDRFEIVAAMTVTFLLIEAPMMVDLIPPSLQLIPVFLALLGPGVAVVWKETAALRESSTRRRAAIRLALTSLVYSQIAALLWMQVLDISDILKNMSDVSLEYLSIPVLLVLVAAHNPERIHLSVRVEPQVSAAE